MSFGKFLNAIDFLIPSFIKERSTSSHVVNVQKIDEKRLCKVFHDDFNLEEKWDENKSIDDQTLEEDDVAQPPLLVDSNNSSKRSTLQQPKQNDHESLNHQRWSKLYKPNRKIFPAPNRLSFKNRLRNNFSSPDLHTYPTMVSPPPSPQTPVPLWSEQADPDTKKIMDPMDVLRQEIIFEIIRTEREFVEDLDYLLEYYAAGIQNSGIQLPQSLLQSFAVLQEIYYFHKNISRHLLNLQAIYPIVPSITDVFRDLANRLHVYDKLLVHHKDAIAEVANARKKNTKLGMVIMMLEMGVTAGRYRSFDSLFIKPIQRVCKYPLLVMTLLRATSPQNLDHSNLRKLYQKMDCIIRELHQEQHVYAKKDARKFKSKPRILA